MADTVETPITESTGDSEQSIQELPDIKAVGGEEKGIDVSNFRDTIHWSNVTKAGIKHAYIKMSEGASILDKKFVENWNGASKAGIKLNCYNYFRALDCNPKQQFVNIKKNTEAVKFDPANNSLAIDVELKGNEKATPAQMAGNLNPLLDLIKKDPVLSRKATMIYTSAGYWNFNVKFNKYKFDAYPLWVAHWGAEIPKIPASWANAKNSWVWWQYSATGKVNGIAGNVDLDWVKVLMNAQETRIP